jgi:hypothetical protein
VKEVFVTAFKDLHMSRVPKNSIVIPAGSSPGPGFEVSQWDFRFTPPLCNYSRSPSTWDLQFSSASQLGESTRKWSSQFRLGEVDPSFKEFVASPATMHLGLMSIKPDVRCTKLFSACYFLRALPL